MNRLDNAVQRLNSAIDDLDQSLGAVLARNTGGDQLKQELDTVRSQHAELATVTDDVCTRLDSAIGRLQAALSR